MKDILNITQQTTRAPNALQCRSVSLPELAKE